KFVRFGTAKCNGSLAECAGVQVGGAVRLSGPVCSGGHRQRLGEPQPGSRIHGKFRADGLQALALRASQALGFSSLSPQKRRTRKMSRICRAAAGALGALAMAASVAASATPAEAGITGTGIPDTAGMAGTTIGAAPLPPGFLAASRSARWLG